MMLAKKHSRKFWAGNIILALSMAVLFFMGPLASWIGTWAMALWMGMAAVGFYLITSDKEPAANDLD
jgi:low affinity Fe/Cu permease